MEKGDEVGRKRKSYGRKRKESYCVRVCVAFGLGWCA